MSRPKNIRHQALMVLLAQAEEGKPLDRVLAQHLVRHPLADPRDRQLLMAMVYGVLRWRGVLDEVAARYSRHPLAKMKPLTLAALRLGILQLLFFDRVPAAAAIDETIKALQVVRQPRWLTGFVNALLRAVARDRGQIKMPDELHSHPEWLRQRWLARYGQESTRELCRINNLLPPLVLRVNLLRTTVAQLATQLGQAGIEVEPGAFVPEALLLPSYQGRIEELPGYGLGWFAVQDQAAQLVSLLLAGGPTGRYLDACAGLGGKTAHLAQLLPPASQLLALEPQLERFTLLQENLTRLGVAALTRQQSLEEFVADRSRDGHGGGVFQGILVDAPCSGLGVIRRHPDIRWNRQAADLAGQQERQVALLGLAAELLIPGGVLVYAVCSHEPEENEGVIARLLAACPHLTLDDPRPRLPAAARSLVGEDHFFRSLPSAGLDGFFAARLSKN
ncbi:16S rRNA (cytosine(967)-C(5))-methyltransferase RsmB [Desulfurivibrio sp. D14AmB]|uniref:16S rRNA (cytosine(967)-C(5))-methyltransferase RsmB n=1 Tax=Desulfurivibrio sp. D14AmB TaxID=3374370 RepID=UPI00376EEABA